MDPIREDALRVRPNALTFYTGECVDSHRCTNGKRKQRTWRVPQTPGKMTMPQGAATSPPKFTTTCAVRVKLRIGKGQPGGAREVFDVQPCVYGVDRAVSINLLRNAARLQGLANARFRNPPEVLACC